MIISIIKYDELELANYLKNLKIVGSISKLFSNNSIPFLHYRSAENLYCLSFDTKNLSRKDISIDVKNKIFGVGIKTFLETKSKKTYQKIAEFNKQLNSYCNLNYFEKIKKIAELRNKRLSFSKNLLQIDKMIYHCVVRNEKGFLLFEEKMNFIDNNSIEIISQKNHKSIFFTDGIDKYMFNISKSTLYKQFNCENYFANINVDIFDNPLNILLECLSKKILLDDESHINEVIILPLYSFKDGEKWIYEKSGLNQWNASGRKRDLDEVYIPFPKEVRDVYENFFPKRDEIFNVILPSGKNMSMKICQDGGKAIMSNPNKELGKWILRDVLSLTPGTLLTYQDLLDLEIDSISFEKINKYEYKLNFEKLGSYDQFMMNDILEDPDYEE